MSLIVWIIGGLIVVAGFTALTGAPYVPSRPRDVAAAFDDLYQLKSSDVLLDLGAGDGVVLKAATERGARAIGYELHPVLVLIARWRLRHEPRARIQLKNIWRAPFPDDTTVVYVFADSRDIRKLVRKLQREATRLQRRLAVISYGFELPDQLSVKKVRSHFLYQIEPLQRKDSTV